MNVPERAVATPALPDTLGADRRPAPVPRSAFVTVLGWLMVAGSFMGILGSLAPLAISGLMVPTLLGDLPPDMQLPVSPVALLRIVALVSLLSSLYTLYASVALLNRRNWARRFFIAMFALGIVCNLMFLASLGLLTFAGALPALDALGLPPALGLMLTAAASFFLGSTLLTTALLWWWVHRLRAPATRAEFLTVPPVGPT